MEELKNKVIITNVPYICLIDESTFNKEGYNYEVLTYFYDEDFELPSYIGITKNKNLTFDEFKADCIKKEVEKLKKLKEKITKDEYFIHNDEIFPTYFILEENLKKYKRRKLGNPDVLKFVQYQKEHPEVTSYENHYDIKYFAQLVDIYPKDIIDNVVMKTRAISKEENASIERRKEVNEYIMDIKLDIHNIDRELYYSFFEDIELEYKNIKKDIDKYLSKYSKIYLFFVTSDTSKKIILKKLNFPIEKISLNEFSIDNFINLKENTLYLFCKNN
ncbi:MAG: hypothetical protein SO232_01220 [Candidatus Onthovivens sp.]|nr:hypothetical protein [Candidatus Onthovivens sp.]